MMIKEFFALLFLLAATVALGQDTLRHFSPSAITPVADTYQPENRGYHTGHNEYFDEEFAEKYEIDGSGEVLGVVAIHEGEAGTSSMYVSYTVYGVADDGLPGALISRRSVPYDSIPVDGSEYTMMFYNIATVSEEFFISFDLGNYSHGDMGTKRIAIAHTPDGTRPSSDFSTYGRNAIRWHDHGNTLWRDYRTENFQSYRPAVHFSLFPIVQLNVTSVVEFDDQGSSIGSVFPNPSAQGRFTIPVNTASGGEAVFQLFDVSGKIVSERDVILPAGKTDYLFSDSGLVPGTYFLLIRIPEGSISQKVIIN